MRVEVDEDLLAGLRRRDHPHALLGGRVRGRVARRGQVVRGVDLNVATAFICTERERQKVVEEVSVGIYRQWRVGVQVVAVRLPTGAAQNHQVGAESTRCRRASGGSLPSVSEAALSKGAIPPMKVRRVRLHLLL